MLVKRVYVKCFNWIISFAFHDFGENSIFDLPLRLSNPSSIRVGTNVYIGSGSWLNVIGSPTRTTIKIQIGNGCSAAGCLTISAAQEIVIEDDVLIARNVYISDHSHRFDDGQLPIKSQGIDRIAPVKIGRGSWIGQNAVIFPGVSIGRGAVIGANSVVRESVPDRCVAAGVPARIIRRLD